MTRFDDNEPIELDYRGMIVNSNAIVIDDGSTHCTECFSGSQDTNFGYGDVAIPEGCKDEDCECHGPLVDESGRPLTTETFRERFTRDFNFEVNDAVGLIFLAVPILMLCLISFLAGDVK